MHRSTTSSLAAVTVSLAAACLLLSGCAGTDAGGPSDAAAEAADGWPRTITHEAGDTEIEAEPLRIVSVSPSLTGSLLAIDAPVIASAATTVSALTDDKGFFTQWADIADERGVEVAYDNLELDLDAIDLLEPDLIVGSANGGDTTLDAYDQLSEIAPTVLLDYGTASWQNITETLGEMTGLEDAATATLAEYDEWVADQAAQIDLPAQPVTALVYLGADGAWAFDDSSPQAALLTSVGFDYATLPEEYIAEQTGANGVDVITSENLAAALDGSETVFAVAINGGDAASTFAADPLVANQPAVAAERVYTLSPASFRLDYYSAKSTVEQLLAAFAD